MILLSIRCLDLLFSNLAGLSNAIFWVRTPDSKKQLYVSESLKTVYGHSPEDIYKNPNLWSASIHSEDLHQVTESIFQRLNNQLNNIINDHPIFYRVSLPNGNTNFIKNVSFSIKDVTGRTLSISGFSESLSEQEWNAAKNQTTKEKTKPELFIGDFAKMLQPELSRNSSELITTPKNLSPRETELMSLMLQGKSAKQIAKVLGLSNRTVENYFESIKRKFNCRTKLELISKLSETEYK